MQQHVQDVRKLYLRDEKSDSFAAHFVKQVPKDTAPKEIKNFVKIKVDILWKGNPLSCVKTFGTRCCKLCSKERVAILKSTRNSPKFAINKCNEVHGACRHKPRFHRFNQAETDDDANKPALMSPQGRKDPPPIAEVSSDEGESQSQPPPELAARTRYSAVNSGEPDTFPRPSFQPYDYANNTRFGLRARSDVLRGDVEEVETNLEEEVEEMEPSPACIAVIEGD